MKLNRFFVAFSLYVAWVVGFSVHNYQTEKNDLMAALDLRLVNAARNLLYIIPEDLHHKNMRKSDLSKEQDRELLLRMNEYVKVNDVYYVYSMIKQNDKVYFTAGNGTDEDTQELNGGGYYFYLYEEAQAHIYQSFEAEQPFFHDTQDHWGSFRSVFIPVFSKDGTKFIVGADIPTAYVDERLRIELFFTVGFSVLFLVFGLPVYFAFTSETRLWAKNLERETLRARANEAKLSTILNLAVDAIITIDRKGKVISFNNAASKMFGYAADEIIGKNVKLIMPESYRDRHDKFMQTYHDTGERKVVDRTIELTAERKNGQHFPIEISVSEVNLIEGERLFSAIIRDLTEKKEKEKQLLHLIEKSQEANRAKSEFLNNVSHELRTPMHGILAFAQLGKAKTDKTTPLDQEKLEKYFENIQKSGNRLKTLLDDLLDFAKLEANKLQLKLEQVCVKDIVDDCVEEQRALLKARHITLSTEYTAKTGITEADSTRLSQVLINLLSNAIKFSKEHKEIRIKIRDVDSIMDTKLNAIEVSVADQGQGVPPEKREQIFEKFTQAGEHTEEIGGTGLGLAICRKLIHAHHGHIWCQESEWGGAEFVFRIPVLQH
ncbi:MAG: PAS domain-containing sensor histidine kinase [Gammaproteobacteria bacterium]|nr:PAS domain-containing sensor histidine kinase [Gammaproteobacteria bacterium]